MLAGFALTLVLSANALAQPGEVPTLRLDGLTPAGVRASVTDNLGILAFHITNFTKQDRKARVAVFYKGKADVQYARDVSVPARATVTSWLLIGRAPDSSSIAHDIEFLLYDRTDGTDRLLLPRTEKKTRERGILYRKPESFTAIVLDEEAPEGPEYGKLPMPESRTEEAVVLTRTFRQARSLSEMVGFADAGPLPPIPESYDGIQHLVIASNRVAADAPGLRALRHWLQKGGKIWVMLDMVEPAVVSALLGDALDFQMVDRVRLDSFRIDETAAKDAVGKGPRQDHELPIEFVRVLLPDPETARHSIDGWPLWFTRHVGKGKVVFTTLGARAWFRPRERGDGPSPFVNFPAQPTPLPHLEFVAEELHSVDQATATDVTVFGPLLGEEIGYNVASRGSVTIVFAGFLAGALAVGVYLRKSSRREWLGWLAPAGALAAALVLVFMADSSRRSAAPTVAVAQVVVPDPSASEATVHGLLALYRPESGAAHFGVDKGGFFELDMSGAEGQSRRLLLTDLDRWHLENLTLPAGLRMGPFQWSCPTSEPMRVVARFGPKGMEGKISAGPFKELSDAFLYSPYGRNLAINDAVEGIFSADSSSVLPEGQFLVDAVLDDRQQRRQDIYRKMLPTVLGQGAKDRHSVLAWAKPVDMGFRLMPEARFVGSALIVFPIEFERPLPGSKITIPGTMIPYRRMMPSGTTPLIKQFNLAADLSLRFQLPAAALPLRVERARLVAKIQAPVRRVTISGMSADGPVQLHQADGPLDPFRVDITDARLLQLDSQGGLSLNVSIGEVAGVKPGPLDFGKSQKWTIDYLELDVEGTVTR
ncbi:MAG: hypothetical protein L0Y72_31090 [Gemmataceae bacterium]|nr:hypothetical protein [Gemmataceae bacterium]MCI0743496.1 hypothetical protein [Gemmataceae bacterium]